MLLHVPWKQALVVGIMNYGKPQIVMYSADCGNLSMCSKVRGLWEWVHSAQTCGDCSVDKWSCLQPSIKWKFTIYTIDLGEILNALLRLYTLQLLKIGNV